MFHRSKTDRVWLETTVSSILNESYPLEVRDMRNFNNTDILRQLLFGAVGTSYSSNATDISTTEELVPVNQIKVIYISILVFGFPVLVLSIFCMLKHRANKIRKWQRAFGLRKSSEVSTVHTIIPSSTLDGTLSKGDNANHFSRGHNCETRPLSLFSSKDIRPSEKRRQTCFANVHKYNGKLNDSTLSISDSVKPLVELTPGEVIT